MIKLGITGGLGSGKSLAAEFFARKGAAVFDADAEAKHHLHNSKSLQRKLINVFGKKITNDQDKLDYKLLAEAAFASKMDQQILNGIVWPEIYILVEKAAEKAQQQNEDLFVVDAALLLEAKFTGLFDKILLIAADREIKIERALARGNLSEEQIHKRISLQLTDAEKRKLADHTILNNGTIRQFYGKLERFARKYL